MVRSTLAPVASRTDSYVISRTHSYSISHVQSWPLEAENNQYDTKDVDEDEKARMDRLGRERPAKFKSFTAEVCFCYSILASMIMVVGSSGSFSRWSIVQHGDVFPTNIVFLVGVLRQRLQCPSTHRGREARDTSGVPSLASKCLLTRHSSLSPAVRSTG